MLPRGIRRRSRARLKSAAAMPSLLFTPSTKILGLTQLRSSASQRRVLPAAAWYFPIYLCAVFPRYARKNRTPLNMEYRATEGWQGQLRKSWFSGILER